MKNIEAAVLLFSLLGNIGGDERLKLEKQPQIIPGDDGAALAAESLQLRKTVVRSLMGKAGQLPELSPGTDAAEVENHQRPQNFLGQLIGLPLHRVLFSSGGGDEGARAF